MIRARIRHIFNNYSKKFTIYDYVQKPPITIKKENVSTVKYMARPVFNSIKSGSDKTHTNASRDYRKYKMKHSKKRIKI